MVEREAPLLFEDLVKNKIPRLKAERVRDKLCQKIVFFVCVKREENKKIRITTEVRQHKKRISLFFQFRRVSQIHSVGVKRRGEKKGEREQFRRG